MSRLTINDDGKYVMCNIDDECDGMCGTCKRNTQIRQKLREYENLEEKGLLLKLPCKVRDRFWELNTVNGIPHIYPRMAHSLQHCVYVLERLGSTTFLTKEEAEQALEKMG